MRLPDRIRLPLTFDPARLAADLAQLGPDDWTGHFVKQNYEGDWSAIGLRAPAGARHPIQMIYSDPNAHDVEDTPFLARMPYIRGVLAQFACPLGAVRLMRLAPGSRIKEHHDNDLDAANGVARLHIPAVTNPAVTFRLNGTPVHMAPGETWYLRLSDSHNVINDGTTDRVHLVIDAIVDEWLGGLLAESATTDNTLPQRHATSRPL